MKSTLAAEKTAHVHLGKVCFFLGGGRLVNFGTFFQKKCWPSLVRMVLPDNYVPWHNIHNE